MIAPTVFRLVQGMACNVKILLLALSAVSIAPRAIQTTGKEWGRFTSALVGRSMVIHWCALQILAQMMLFSAKGMQQHAKA
jgi:hypothetical protein